MRSGMFDNTEVYSADFARFAGGLLTNGVLADSTTALQVSEGTGMQVSVAPGYCWINGRFGVAETAETLSIGAADGSLGRIDRVVARLDLSAPSVSLQVIQGEASASPEVPALVRAGNYYDLGLALVSVPAGTLAITSSLITDTRDNADVCGAVIYRNADRMAYDSKANKGSAFELIWDGTIPYAPSSGFSTAHSFSNANGKYREYRNVMVEAVGKRHSCYLIIRNLTAEGGYGSYLLTHPTGFWLTESCLNQCIVQSVSYEYKAFALGGIKTGSIGQHATSVEYGSYFATNFGVGEVYIFDYCVKGDQAHFAICHKGYNSTDSAPARYLQIYGVGEPIDET